MVGGTHAAGAGLGLTKDTGSNGGKGYPVEYNEKTKSYGFPTANELGSSNRNITNLDKVTDGSKQVGDIFAWKTTGDPTKEAGHSAIYIGGGMVVYAGGPNGGNPIANTFQATTTSLTGNDHYAPVQRRYSGGINGKP